MSYIEDQLINAIVYYEHAIPSERSRALDHMFYKRAFGPLFDQAVAALGQFYASRKTAQLYGCRNQAELHLDNIHNYTRVLAELGRRLRMKPIDVFWTLALEIERLERSIVHAYEAAIREKKEKLLKEKQEKMLNEQRERQDKLLKT